MEEPCSFPLFRELSLHLVSIPALNQWIHFTPEINLKDHKTLLPAGSPLMSCFPFNSLISVNPAGVPRIPGATFPAQGLSATSGPSSNKGEPLS